MSKHAWTLVGGIAVCVLWLVTPRCAFACSCAPPGSPDVELAQSVSVFAGRVLQIEQPTGQRVTFQVATVWKGPAYTSLVVHIPPDAPMCGYPFEPNQEYVVYAQGTETRLIASVCSRTQRLVDARDDIQRLGQGITPQTPAPDRAGPSASQTVPISLLLSSVILLGVLAVWGIRRRTRKERLEE